MNIRTMLLSVELLGCKSDNEDVTDLLRELWTELRIIERELNEKEDTC